MTGGHTAFNLATNLAARRYTPPGSCPRAGGGAPREPGGTDAYTQGDPGHGIPGMTRSDEALMEEVRAGSASAFQVLYQRHRGAVFSFLLHSLGDRPAAEDLLQETFLRVFQGRERYRPTARFKTWLFTIARHLLIDRHRKRGEAVGLDDRALEALTDPTSSPLAAAEAQELGQRVADALARLPPGQREVLLLVRFGGLSAEEVARITSASVGAVRVTLHRALRRLRDLLALPESPASPPRDRV